MFMRCISMFFVRENYVLLYKSAYYEVKNDYGKRTQYSVLSTFLGTIRPGYHGNDQVHNTPTKNNLFKKNSRNPCQFQKEIVTLWCGI